MKCTRCGAEIRKGNLYCSNCGAEVQIVSADNVMEEEFFLDFQRREMRAAASETDAIMGSELEPELESETKSLSAAHHKTGKRQNHRKLVKGWLTATAGICGLVVIGVLLCARGAKAAQNSTDPAYDEMIIALANGEDEQAAGWLQKSQLNQTEPSAGAFWQAWLYGQQADEQQQIRTLQEILATDEDNVYACRELIRIYVSQGNFEALHDFYDAYADTALAGLFADYLVAAPVIEAPTEPVWEGDTLTIQAQNGLNIYYTLDGTSPVTDGTLYYAPLQLQAGEYTISAVACNEDGYYSPVVTHELKVEEHYQLGMPQVTPDSGEYLTPQTIYISVPAGCTAYYTWNGQNPTTASARYSGGISMPEGNNVLSVIVVDAYGNESSIQRVNYIYMP